MRAALECRLDGRRAWTARASAVGQQRVAQLTAAHLPMLASDLRWTWWSIQWTPHAHTLVARTSATLDSSALHRQVETLHIPTSTPSSPRRFLHPSLTSLTSPRSFTSACSVFHASQALLFAQLSTSLFRPPLLLPFSPHLPLVQLGMRRRPPGHVHSLMEEAALVAQLTPARLHPVVARLRLIHRQLLRRE